MTDKLGIAGGGQLARMMLSTCIDWDYKVRILDKAGCVSQAFCQDFVHGDYLDGTAVFEAFKECDIVTLDLEAVSIEGLTRLENTGVRVAPSSSVLSIIQNKILQKEFFKENGIASSEFQVVKSLKKETPVGFLKIPVGGYDGKGVCAWKGNLSQIDESFKKNVLWEEAVNIDKEISIIGVRGFSGEVKLYDPTEMVFDHELNLISHTLFPARISLEQKQTAMEMAKEVIEKLQVVGVLAIEMFLTKAGEILVNELAPRPHNSGHHTIESCKTSQFENHIRAVTGQALGPTAAKSKAITFNIIGRGNGLAQWSGIEDLLAMDEVFVHNYGKNSCREGRKMGHITVTGMCSSEVLEKLKKIRSLVKVEGVEHE